MKLKILGLCLFIFLFDFCTQANASKKSINDHTASFTTAIRKLGDIKGAIITENTVVFTEDITIPKGITLKFSEKDRIVVNSGVTVTINGSISAGKFQIFDVADGGVVKGCPRIGYAIPQWWGTDDKGIKPASDLFQKAVESFPCVKKFVASGTFLVDKEILLNINQRNYDFSGSHFIGTEVGTLNGAGGLITIGNRGGRKSESYSVRDVSLKGGIYEPRFNHDNSLSILHAKNVKISNVSIKGTKGLRGIALQTPKLSLSSNPIIENVTIENVIQEGGVNLINIDVNNGFVKNVDIRNVFGSSVDEVNPQPHINSKEAAFRLSSQGDALRIKDINISDVTLENVYIGFELRGVKVNISNVKINNVVYRGVVTQFADTIDISEITIVGSSNLTEGVVTIGSPTVLKSNISVFKLTLLGRFKVGFINQVNNIKANSIHVDAEFTFGIRNIATNASFKNILIKNAKDSYNHSGVYNHATATGCNFEGAIQGNYDYGFINAAQGCTSDFQMNGSFKNGAIFTFYNNTGYSSLYKGSIYLTDAHSKYINRYRAGDIYQFYVYHLVDSFE